MTPNFVEIRDVSKQYPVRSRLPFARARMLRALSGVSLGIDRGEVVSLVGESGSGKSTLGHVVMGTAEPSSGSVFFDGQRLDTLNRAQRSPLRRRMQLVFQDPYSSLNPNQTIGAMLTEILRFHRIATRRDEQADRVRSLLGQVGLPAGAERRYPHEFSGGQRQRVVIARALATDPDFIVADEPVSALDVSIQAQIIQLLKKLRAERDLTLLMISHDLAVVQNLSDRVGVLYLGHLVELAPTSQIFSRPRHPYTEMLLSAIPSLRGRTRRVTPTGEIPSPISPPSGCVFRTRCAYAMAECARAVPPLREVKQMHFTACIRDDISGG